MKSANMSKVCRKYNNNILEIRNSTYIDRQQTNIIRESLLT